MVFGDFKNGHALAAHEMDMILEWSSGGYPQGPRNLTPAPPLVADTWALGEPTLTLQLAEPFVLGPSATTSFAISWFLQERVRTIS